MTVTIQSLLQVINDCELNIFRIEINSYNDHNKNNRTALNRTKIIYLIFTIIIISILVCMINNTTIFCFLFY